MKIIAFAVADLHLSSLQPACRADADWWEVQARYLTQLKTLAKGKPILCAGDIFDKWNPTPELIHFALRHLPDGMLCVPGQHDLPNHRIDQVDRSGYGVLVEARKIRDISGATIEIEGTLVSGFGWEQTITPPAKGPFRKLALLHQYCWINEMRYPDAPASLHANKVARQLKGYNMAIVGDNHKGFTAEYLAFLLYNCGGFIRRKSDEIPSRPSVGIIYDDGTIHRHHLDVSADRFHEEAEEPKATTLDMKSFITGLEELGEHGLNFQEAVENFLRGEGLRKEVKEIITNAMTNECDPSEH